MTQFQSDLFYTGGAGAIAVPKVTDWVDFTPTWINGGSITSEDWKYRQVGSSMEIQGQVVWGGTGAANLLLMEVPSGLTIDADIPIGASFHGILGNGGHFDSGGSLRETLSVWINTNQRFGFLTPSKNSFLGSEVDTGDIISLTARMPIVEWPVDQLVGSSLNRWQTKFLNGDVTADADADLGDIQFNGLEIGKTYRVSVLPYIETSVTDDNAAILGVHDGNTVLRARANTSGSSLEIDQFTSSCIFTATATTFTWSGESTSANAIIRGNNTRDETWAMIEELNNYQTETTAFS